MVFLHIKREKSDLRKVETIDLVVITLEIFK